MDCVVLAGGFGTRLRPLTYTRPKPLLPVAGRPMVEHTLARLPDVERIVVAVNWKADELEAYFEEHAEGRDIKVVREDEPLGTAGAVKNCADALRSDSFFVLNADIVSDMDLGAMARAHDAAGGIGTIALKEVPDADVPNYGVVAFAEDDGDDAGGADGRKADADGGEGDDAGDGDADGGDEGDAEGARRIARFVEKPRPEEAPSRLINAGAYLLSQEVLERIETGRLVSMEQEIFPRLIDDGLYGWTHSGLWVDVGDPKRLREASKAVDKAFTHPGDAAIGEDSVVLDSIAGRNLRVGDRSRLERCVVGDDVTIADETFLLDCVIGDGETVGGARAHERIWTREVPAGYPDKQVGNRLGRPVA